MSVETHLRYKQSANIQVHFRYEEHTGTFEPLEAGCGVALVLVQLRIDLSQPLALLRPLLYLLVQPLELL